MLSMEKHNLNKAKRMMYGSEITTKFNQLPSKIYKNKANKETIAKYNMMENVFGCW